MFDANYFKNHLKTQVSQVAENAVVKMYSRDGTEYLIQDIMRSEPGLLLLNVHAATRPGPIVAASSSAYSQVPVAGYHPVAVAYESIANIYFSTTTAAMRPKIGFNV